MDNITHGALGIAASLLAAPAGLRKKAALGGLIAAELPDLDIFLVSLEDPLFSLQVHRHFSHSLMMVPLLAVLGVLFANLFRWMFRRERVWRGMWLPALAAAATHGLCDTWTSYGTHLWWPFLDRREALHLISVIDPILTLPLLAGAVLGWRHARRRPALIGLAWTCLYLGLCSLQQHRARETVKTRAAREGHSVQRLTVKPSFGNIMVWRCLYEHEGICQVVCVRPGITESARILGTSSAALVDPDHPVPPFDTLPPNSVQARDVRRFQHFSGNFMGVHPRQPNVIGDFRYASRPDRIDPLWGIVVDATQPARHVKLAFFREFGSGSTEWLWKRVLGLE